MFVVIKWLAEKLKGAGDKSLTDLYDKLVSIETTGNPRAKKFTVVDIETTTTILPGATETITITPPAGKVYKILSMRYEAPPPTGATSGDHYVILYNMIKYTGIRFASTYTTKILYWHNDPSAITDYKPPSAEAIILALNNTYGTNTKPITFFYVNATDVSQTNARIVQLVLEIFDELS